MAKTKVLILPGDTPPDKSAIKRQLLFFDSVFLMSPDDSALINKRDIIETFPNGRTIWWGEYVPYPRSDNYADALRVIAAETSKLQADGKLRFLQPAPRNMMDPTKIWVASAAASSDSKLLRAAIPDHHSENAPLHFKPGCYNMVVPADEHYASRHNWLVDVRHSDLSDVGMEWSRLAACRLGRALKSISRAGIEHAFPLATDGINESICLALGAKAFSGIPSTSQLADTCISMDVVDPRELNIALADLSWDGVARLRREVLPHVAKLRGLIEDAVKMAHKPQNVDLGAYSSALAGLKEKHKKAGDAARETWRKLGFKTLDAAFLSGAGLIGVAAPPVWAKVVTAFAVSMLAKVAGGTAADARSLVVANKQQRATPLFFFDTLVDTINKEATRERTEQS